MKKSTVIKTSLVCIASMLLAGCSLFDKTYTASEILSQNGYDNISDYVTLCDLKTIDTDSGIEETTVTDEQVDAYFQMILLDRPQYSKSKNKTITEEDCININCVAKSTENDLNNVFTDYYFDLSSDFSLFPSEFKDNLIGHRAGDEVKFEIFVDDEYLGGEYSGTKISYTVKINGIFSASYYSVDDVTDDIVKKLFDYDTVDDYKNYLKMYLSSAYEWGNDATHENYILDQIVEKSTFSSIDSLVDRQLNEELEEIKASADEDGVSLDDYLADAFAVNNEKEYRETYEESAETTIKQNLVLYAVMNEMQYEISESEFHEYMQQYLEVTEMEDEEEIFDSFGSEQKFLLWHASTDAFKSYVESLS